MSEYHWPFFYVDPGFLSCWTWTFAHRQCPLAQMPLSFLTQLNLASISLIWHNKQTMVVDRFCDNNSGRCHCYIPCLRIATLNHAWFSFLFNIALKEKQEEETGMLLYRFLNFLRSSAPRLEISDCLQSVIKRVLCSRHAEYTTERSKKKDRKMRKY